MKKSLFSWALCWAIGCLALFGGSFALADEEYKFDLSEIEKKPYHIGGYLELKPSISRLGSDASLYKLRFFNRDEGNTLEEYNGKLQLEGSLEKGIARLFVRTNLGFEIFLPRLGPQNEHL